MVEIHRLKKGEEFEFNGEKYIVTSTVMGFGTEVGAKSVKRGEWIKIPKNHKVLVE